MLSILVKLLLTFSTSKLFKYSVNNFDLFLFTFLIFDIVTLIVTFYSHPPAKRSTPGGPTKP